MSDKTILEGYFKNSVKPVSLEGTNIILNQMKFSVCKILKVEVNGTGFFCNLPYKSKVLPFLITNNHILNNEDIKIDKSIKLWINNEFKNIKIDEKRIVMTNEKLDFTLIEIKKDIDNIDIKNCLELNESINIEEQYINEVYANSSIYAIHYPKDENVVVSYGLMSQIFENEIHHLCNTEGGSSGAPILSLKDFKVIGIHCGARKKFNKGTFIKYVISELDKYDENQSNNNIQNNNINHNINFINNNNINQKNINNNFVQFNNNIVNQNMNIDNMLKNNDKIYQQKIDDDKNITNKNNNEFKKLSENSIMAFPNENNCELVNIIFNSSNGKMFNIIIPKHKTLKELFYIYSKVISIDMNDYDKKFLFSYNVENMNINDQRPISQVLDNLSVINVYFS